MHQIEFIPVTIEMEISSNEKIGLQRWSDILQYFFNLYAKELTHKEKTYIGHIKVLSIIDEDTSLKLSIYKSNIAAEVDLKGDSSSDHLSLLVNSFVYGVTEQESLEALDFISNKLEKEFMLKTVLHNRKHHH